MKPDLKRLGGKIEEERERFGAFYDLLLEYNEKFNLTAVTEEKEVYLKHFLDSAAGEELFPFGANVAEVGSGAGFPSVPLMLIRRDLTFTLFESVHKKCEFLRVAAAKLSLPAKVLPMRAEEAGRGEYREKFDVCCARAVARMATLSEYCLPLVKKGGRFIAYKGEAEEELEEAGGAISLLGGKTEEVLSFELPENVGKRMIVCVKKVKNTPSAYPRGRGKERRDPLK